MKTSIIFSLIPNKDLTDTIIKDLVSGIYKLIKRHNQEIIFHDNSSEIIGDFELITNILREETFRLNKQYSLKNIQIKMKIKFLDE